MTATHTEIIHHFLDLVSDPYTGEDNLGGNWGTSIDNSKWKVDDNTYINGIMATIDFDYHMGYIIEVCDTNDDVMVTIDGQEFRSNLVNWFAIVTYHGRGKDGRWPHDSCWYNAETNCPPQQFFDRTIDSLDICQWGMARIFGMMESYEYAKKATHAKEVKNDIRGM